MAKVLDWIKLYWYIPAVVVVAGVAILASAFTRRRGTSPVPGIIDAVTQEVRVIQAGAEVKKVQAELGAVKAQQLVDEQYLAAKDKLTAAQVAEAKTLEDDPVALSRFLVRAGAKSP
jgi:hypothetical protein